MMRRCSYSTECTANFMRPALTATEFGTETINTTLCQTKESLEWLSASWQLCQHISPSSSQQNAAFGWRTNNRRPNSPNVNGLGIISSAIIRARQTKRPKLRLIIDNASNFRCQIEGCYGVFCSSYSLSVHMKTHEMDRKYSFWCASENCNKKFTRRIDQQRHHSAVHLKQRNHRCIFCNRSFGRKDTLRR